MVNKAGNKRSVKQLQEKYVRVDISDDRAYRRRRELDRSSGKGDPT